MNRSLKSARPDSSTYSTSSSTASAAARSVHRERRDLRALAGDVAGRHDARQRQPRHEPDPDRARRASGTRRTSRPSSTCEISVGLDPESCSRICQPVAIDAFANCSSRTSRCDRNTSVGAGRTRAPRRSSREPARRRAEHEAAGAVKHARPAPARRPRRPARSRTSRPASTVADHRQLDLAVDDLDALDRAVGGAHAAADLGRLERGPGGRGGGQHPADEPSTISELVPTSMNSRIRRSSVRPVASMPGDDVAADVRAERREHERGRARVDVDAEVERLEPAAARARRS